MITHHGPLLKPGATRAFKSHPASMAVAKVIDLQILKRYVKIAQSRDEIACPAFLRVTDRIYQLQIPMTVPSGIFKK